MDNVRVECMYNVRVECMYNLRVECMYNVRVECMYNVRVECMNNAHVECMYNVRVECMYNARVECMYNVRVECMRNVHVECMYNLHCTAGGIKPVADLPIPTAFYNTLTKMLLYAACVYRCRVMLEGVHRPHPYALRRQVLPRACQLRTEQCITSPEQDNVTTTTVCAAH
jgi:hypothetical protein